MKRQTFLKACLLGAGAVAAPLGLRAQQRTKVVVGGAVTTMQTLAAYFSSTPLELYWKEENLDVEVIGLPGANVALQALQAKKVDMVPGTHSALFALLEKFPDAGLKTYFIHTNALNSLPAVLDKSPLKTIADLSGKTVGVQSLANSQVPMLKALVQQAGGNPASLNFVAVGEGVEAAHALTTNRVDALALYDGLYAGIEGEGVKLRELAGDFVKRENVGFNAGLIVRQEDIDKNRPMLIGLARGVAKSILFCQTNPEAAVHIHWKVYPATRPRGMPEAEAMRKSLLPLQARLKNVERPGGLFGNVTERQIAGYQQLLVAGGQMKAPMPAAKVWDGSMVREINNFDHDKVIRQAKQWKA
ncbi:ABC transporter substrate-binding protein [Ramlibacter albus]|uniref:ABC transporter substrate-binding protein n=1 Tax=Ramlibacter albus TaxID=2079448 RepID=A0A923S4T4_9BURK|nr:ABC transporter substrate-binding protein [Ramlibacter albus]MBC5767855.1 ABC transporter substrate-binding protein [Ramlibacter albus]